LPEKRRKIANGDNAAITAAAANKYNLLDSFWISLFDLSEFLSRQSIGSVAMNWW
jgi:hypothetical protein